MSTTPEPRPVSLPLTRSLSRPLAVVAGLLLTSGFSVGWLTFLHRSGGQVRHVPGSNAWWQHTAVACVAVAIVAVIWLGRRRERIGPHVLLAPLGRSAADRISVLYRHALRRPAGFGRAVLATPLLLLIMFGFFRVGYQITSGLDPNSTVNAWGGPTYMGAMACHYLDFAVITAAAASLLNVILPRRSRRTGQTGSGSGCETSLVTGSRA